MGRFSHCLDNFRLPAYNKCHPLTPEEGEKPMIELKNVSKVFPTAEGGFHALKDVSLTIGDGDIYGIVGMSGAGKSTLVRCINLLERPTSGQVIIDGTDLCAMGQKQLIAQRRSISMIFQ